MNLQFIHIVYIMACCALNIQTHDTCRGAVCMYMPKRCVSPTSHDDEQRKRDRTDINRIGRDVGQLRFECTNATQNSTRNTQSVFNSHASRNK